MRPEPSRWNEGWARFTRIWRHNTADTVDEELRFHFEQKVADLMATGVAANDARRQAEAEFGDVEHVRESLRAIDHRIEARHRRAEWWEGALQDLRYVMRSLGRSPVFTATVVITLALGLGANAALFSLLDTLFVQTPPGITNPDALRRVYQFMPNNGRSFTRGGLSYPEIRELRAVAPQGVAFAAYQTSQVRFGRAIDAPQIGAAYVEGDYFGVAGVRPALGRFFSPDERRIEGMSMVAVISHAFWLRQFNGDRGVLGREIDLGSHRHVIVGVAGKDFRGLDLNTADVFVPLSTNGVLKGRKPTWFETTNFNGIRTIARVTDEATARLVDARATDALHRVRISNDSLTTTFLGPIIEARGGETFGRELRISTRLAGVAAVILLIACANVVNLMLARTAVRQREIAVRLALGVSRRRLLSQLLIESTVLAMLSAVVALFVAYEGATTLRTLLLPDVHWSEGALNARVALFTGGLAVITGLIAGLAPALQASRPDLSVALKSSVRDGGQRRSSLRSTLLVAQGALSIVLLVGAGVFVRSLKSVESIDTGYDTSRLVFATVSYDRELENRSADITRGLPVVLERIRALPGVEQIALTGNIPLYGFGFSSMFLPGRDSLPPSNGMDRFSSTVSPNYFATVGMRVLRGRDFTDGDRDGTEPVIVIDENLAKNLWPGEDALTKCIIVDTRTSPCRRVIGIVSPSHFANIVEKPSMHFFVPAAQDAANGGAEVIVLRVAAGASSRIGAVVQRELAQYFGTWSRPRIRTMEEIVAPEMRPWRVGASLFTAAGVLALVVAAVGVYSSIAYTISQRTQEMGVRVALGASSSNIMRLVVTEGVRVVAIGVGIGVIAALALGTVVASMLYETSPRDPVVLVVASVTLLLVAMIASAIPAWRASRVDPLSAMRAE